MLSILNPKRTVADVMSAFTQAITDLTTVADAQTAEAERQAAIAAEATRASVEASAEAEKAKSVKAKLDAIVNPTKGDRYAPVN